MTEDEMKELAKANENVAHWQRELRLDHIDFEVSFFKPDGNDDNLGRCKIAPARHRQTIELRHPTNCCDRDRSIFRRDPEVVIVHELLHTKEALWRDHPSIDKPFQEDKWLSGLHEDSLDAIAEALVRARRGIKR
jgi:hypothetical protein